MPERALADPSAHQLPQATTQIFHKPEDRPGWKGLTCPFCPLPLPDAESEVKRLQWPIGRSSTKALPKCSHRLSPVPPLPPPRLRVCVEGPKGSPTHTVGKVLSLSPQRSMGAVFVEGEGEYCLTSSPAEWSVVLTHHASNLRAMPVEDLGFSATQAPTLYLPRPANGRQGSRTP